MDQLVALRKWLRSFRKRNWQLDDYPIRVMYRPHDEPAPPGWIPLPWTAQIINWQYMRGDGETEEQAVERLRDRFSEYRDSKAWLPRPGRGAPPDFEFAPDLEVSRHREIVDDLLRRVIGLDPEQCLVTDESSLRDFHGFLTNDDYYRKIALLYGVDVSDLESPTLAAIAERIQRHRG